jgi:hypothetical protein
VRRLLVLLFVTTLGFVGPLVAASPAHADTVSDEMAFVAKINQLRSGLGLGTLTVDAGLTTIARDWSQQMANAGDISHNPSLANLVSLNWAKLGENVGLGPTVDQLFTAFVNSPHHYANLVDPSFTHVGVGVVWNGSTMFTSHEFMTLRGASNNTVVAATPAPVRTTVARVVVPVTPKPKAPVVTAAPPPVTTTTIAPPPPPPPAPVAPDRVRWINEVLRGLDPSAAGRAR